MKRQKNRFVLRYVTLFVLSLILYTGLINLHFHALSNAQKDRFQDPGYVALHQKFDGLPLNQRPEVVEMIEQLGQEQSASLNALYNNKEAYRRGELSDTEYRRAQVPHQDNLRNAKAYRLFYGDFLYAKEKVDRRALVDPHGWENILTNRLIVSLDVIFLPLLIFPWIWPDQKQSTIQWILATSGGERYYFDRLIRSVLWSATLWTIMTAFMSLSLSVTYWPLPMPHAPLESLQSFGEYAWSISVLQCYMLTLACRLLGLIIVALFCCFVCLHVHSLAVAYLWTISIYLVPLLLSGIHQNFSLLGPLLLLQGYEIFKGSESHYRYYRVGDDLTTFQSFSPVTLSIYFILMLLVAIWLVQVLNRRLTNKWGQKGRHSRGKFQQGLNWTLIARDSFSILCVALLSVLAVEAIVSFYPQAGERRQENQDSLEITGNGDLFSTLELSSSFQALQQSMEDVYPLVYDRGAILNSFDVVSENSTSQMILLDDQTTPFYPPPSNLLRLLNSGHTISTIHDANLYSYVRSASGNLRSCELLSYDLDGRTRPRRLFCWTSHHPLEQFMGRVEAKPETATERFLSDPTGSFYVSDDEAFIYAYDSSQEAMRRMNLRNGRIDMLYHLPDSCIYITSSQLLALDYDGQLISFDLDASPDAKMPLTPRVHPVLASYFVPGREGIYYIHLKDDSLHFWDALHGGDYRVSDGPYRPKMEFLEGENVLYAERLSSDLENPQASLTVDQIVFSPSKSHDTEIETLTIEGSNSLYGPWYVRNGRFHVTIDFAWKDYALEDLMIPRPGFTGK